MTEDVAGALVPVALPARDFEKICRIAYDFCGLNLGPGKEDMVASRIGRIMRQAGHSSFGEYLAYVSADKSQAALTAMIDCLTTNHTSFFREQQHFDFLSNTLFPLVAERPHLDIWSAACSTGEEPFSLAFAAREFYGTAGPDVRILATDISTRVLDLARKATYEAARFRDVPQPLMQRYLQRGTGLAEGLYRVKPDIRSSVTFRRMNLIEPFIGVTTTFPLVLCRNAMIYFDSATQEALANRLYQQIEPGGYLFIGHSESLSRIAHSFEYVCPAIYRRPGLLQQGARVRRGTAA